MWRFQILLSTPLLFATLAQRGTVASLMERYALSSATCTDGSPGFFYMAANASSNNFIFRIMGGGGCAYNETYCEETLEISAPLFTSNGWPDATVGVGLLSGVAVENPLYSTFNRVFVPYCTQDLFLLDTESPGGELQFRGRPFLEEILVSVLGQSAEGSTAVLLGSSAGGVGAFNVASWLLDSFEQVTELSLVLDSAFFFDVDGTLTLGLEYLREHPSVAYSTHCSEEFDGGPCCMQFGCMAHRGYYPMENERLKGTMLLSPAQDALPLFLETSESATAVAGAQDEAEEVDFSTLWGIATYTGQARSLLHNIASIYPAAVSVFAPSCTDHILFVSTSAELWMCAPGYEKPVANEYYDDFVCTLGEEDELPVAATYVRTLDGIGLRAKFGYAAEALDNLQIEGTSMRTATEEWWAGRGDASKQVFLFDSCDDLNCNPTCKSELLPGTRNETDDIVVWVMVLATFMTGMLILTIGTLAVVWGLRQGQRAAELVASALDREETEEDAKGESWSSIRDLRLQISMERGAKKNGGGDGCGSGAKPILEWRELNYWLPATKGESSRTPSPAGKGSTAATASRPEKQLLHSMHGTVPEGALCALMGPSGCGKSTLLDLLTGRKDIGRCGGEVLFRGRSIANQPEVYISQSGYMRQLDTGYLDGLTVLENLVYAAMLRLPGTLEHQSRRVQTVIEQTSLERSAHTVARGLSGGQKRRLKIALELLANRQIFFLDEPSSGLDASASLELAALLKRLSRTVTLVVAIHQPRPEVWELFSHAILLSCGRTVYCGPADSAMVGTASYVMDTIPTKPVNPGHAPSAVVDGSKTRRSSMFRSLSAPGNTFGVSVFGSARGAFLSNSSRTIARPMPMTSPISDQTTAACRLERVGSIFGMQRWNSSEDCDNKLAPPGDNVEERKSPTRLARASAEGRSGIHADPTRTSRSVPDKVLDRLMVIDAELSGKLQAREEKEAAHNSSSGDGGRNGRMSSTANLLPASITPERTVDSPSSTTIPCGDCNRAENGKVSVWKVVAVLITRSWKNSYAKELVSSTLVLGLSLAFIVISIRVASDEAMMLHLVVSVISVSMLPVLLVYYPVMLISMHDGWPLTKLEIADGFYSPRSATIRYAIEHFAPAVPLSFAAVGITHVVFWGKLISALPVSAVGVDLQLSCAFTLTAWVTIALFDALAISGLSYAQACGASNALNTIWAVFSGTFLLVTSIPAVLKAVTFSSPHYWATFFGLRMLLDGLDLTAYCDYNSKVYCPTSYGDLVAHALDLHIHTPALSLICLVAITSAGLVALAATVQRRGRHVRIIGGLRKPTHGASELFCASEQQTSTDVDNRDVEVIRGRSLSSSRVQCSVQGAQP